jgi:CheY-like chemotaxis protein
VASGVSLRVLVIEDDDDAAETLREALELNGHVVAVAGTGPEGIDAARRFAPGVVLCDLGLPGMDGIEVARAMRSDAALRSMHLVALSGYASPDDVERARQAGFDRHLAKPPSFDDLERMLREVATPAADAAGLTTRIFPT